MGVVKVGGDDDGSWQFAHYYGLYGQVLQLLAQDEVAH